MTRKALLFLGVWVGLILGATAVSEKVFWVALDRFYVGCAEETIFRYFLFDMLLIQGLKLSLRMAIPLSAVVFGLAHYLNGPGADLQVLEATAGGVLFALLYRRYGLWAPIAAHAGFNFLVAILLGK